MSSVCFTVENIQLVVKDIVDKLPCLQNRATVLTLSGDLGSGKTTLVQYIADYLRIKQTVTSPTFVIRKDYHLDDQKWSWLIHIDMYRLEREDDLSLLGIGELLKNPDFLIIIEWPEKVLSILAPEQVSSYKLAVAGENKRLLEKYN